jgi:hypothetical protein
VRWENDKHFPPGRTIFPAPDQQGDDFGRDMFQLIYVSSAAYLFSTCELLELLKTCRANNGPKDITGLLLYKEGNFMQVLEGRQETVQLLHAKIARDPRHRGMLTLWQGPIATRQFSGWSMGFRDLASPEIQALPGFNNFLEVPLTGAEFASSPSRVQTLLRVFKTRM